MAESLTIDLFAEDRAHELFLDPLLQRIASDCKRAIIIRVRSARGGHGKTMAELKLYQKMIENEISPLPDLLVVAIDGNCRGMVERQNEIRNHLGAKLKSIAIEACPDPHIERWYMADLEAFHDVVGITPKLPQQKCKRDLFKSILSRAIVDAKHPPTLGGIEFAEELVQAMDYYRAEKADASLKSFISAAKSAIRQRIT